MNQATLRDSLCSLVMEYGFEQVDQSLRRIGASENHHERTSRKSRLSNGGPALRDRKRGPNLTAPQYVAKMALPPEKESSMFGIAERFHEKSFLPTFGDITNFCQIYSIAEPASRSRVSSIPRVFRFMASMEAEDIQRILTEEAFSGPSRLGPIADAIRRNGRTNSVAHSEPLGTV